MTLEVNEKAPLEALPTKVTWSSHKLCLKTRTGMRDIQQIGSELSMQNDMKAQLCSRFCDHKRETRVLKCDSICTVPFALIFRFQNFFQTEQLHQQHSKVWKKTFSQSADCFSRFIAIYKFTRNCFSIIGERYENLSQAGSAWFHLQV